jgi:hypothetical protein
MTGHVTILTQACCRVRTQQAVMASHADAVFLNRNTVCELELKEIPVLSKLSHNFS